MKQKIVLLVVIAILLAAGYVAWDRSFREEITQQDIELAEKHLQSFNYGTKNLQVFNVYDKYDLAKFIYAQSDAGFALFYKNTGNFISAGQGGRYQGYLSADEKTGRASDEYSAAFWNQTRRKDSVTPEMKNALQEGARMAHLLKLTA